jgi:hypothetical protein
VPQHESAVHAAACAAVQACRGHTHSLTDVARPMADFIGGGTVPDLAATTHRTVKGTPCTLRRSVRVCLTQCAIIDWSAACCMHHAMQATPTGCLRPMSFNAQCRTQFWHLPAWLFTVHSKQAIPSNPNRPPLRSPAECRGQCSQDAVELPTVCLHVTLNR